MTTQWFISDLHLADERPTTVELFHRFLRHLPQPGDRLFIRRAKRRAKQRPAHAEA